MESELGDLKGESDLCLTGQMGRVSRRVPSAV